jgi:heme-degrading monooxygenase HmoA
MGEIASTPEPPYYAVIFTSLRTEGDHGYAEMAARMVELAVARRLDAQEARLRDGLGITVSYWESLEAIRAWHEHAEHRVAQRRGYERWYQTFKTRVCKVERDYGFERPGENDG